jgi:outer membrane protein insertion porin family
LILLIASCGQQKYLKNNQFLLSKNKLIVDGDQAVKTDLENYIRQKPNDKIFGFPFYLWVYNHIDSASIAQKRQIHIAKLRQKNIELYDKQARINQKRNEKAIKQGKSDYKFKTIVPFDTINIRLSFKEWFKVRIGEPPVIFDSINYLKTIEQFSLYLRKKGYYDSQVCGKVDYHKRKNKVKVSYFANTGKVYLIDSIDLKSDNKVLTKLYNDFSSKSDLSIEIGNVFDSDKLNDYREKLSEYMRDHGVYGMNASNIQFVADSNRITKKVNLSLEFSPRLFRNTTTDKVEPIPYQLTKVKNVYFHIIDTSSVPYNFKRKIDLLELNLLNNGYINTIDTVFYTNNAGLIAEKKRNKFDVISDSLRSTRSIILTFNYSYWMRPYALEDANLLQPNTYFNESQFEKTLVNLSNLGTFQSVKPEIVDLGDQIEIHYYLIPRKKLIYNFKPLIKTSGVFVGVSGLANFTNLNLFKGGEKMIFGFSGGFQSMPNLKYNDSTSLNVNDNVKQVFNTFEIGPTLKFELPGIFPLSRNILQKTQKSKTLISASYGFQKRSVFTLQTFRLNYLYSFTLNDNSEFQFGFPGFSSINFVNYLQFDEVFRANIYKTNDPFTQNYYKSQLNWQDFKLVFQYQPINSSNSSKTLFFKSYVDLAGNFISVFSKSNIDPLNSQRTFLGIPYSQFFKIDNEFVVARKLSKSNSFHTRVLAGLGIPYGNSKISVPFDYSFYGGGPNDIRAWRAGTLGPGSYNYYLDKNYSTMQLGDIRLGISSEFRFKLTKTFKGALFVDAGNLWTTNEDAKRPGSKFTSNWYKEIAIGSGVGLRADFEFLVVRIDCGFKLRNPAMSEGHRWFFESKDQQVYSVLDANPNTYVSPFFPRTFNDLFNSFRVGIGYPF